MFSQTNKPKAVAVVGPTASGKTGIAIELAKQFNGEVISADSRQVYRELNVGTAKVTEEEMAGVPHHLLDVADPMEIYTGTDFKRDATIAIDDILSRNALPIIAGGTFFYIELLRGTMQSAPVPPDLEFRATLSSYSNEELLNQLSEKDPRRAEEIDPDNRRRLIRSLEIIETLGSVPKPTVTESPYTMLMIGLLVEKEVLREKYRARAHGWLTDGIVAETEHLLNNGVTRARFQEIGFEYLLALALLDKEITEAEFIEQCIAKNWQYAKRQYTWLQKDNSIEWFDPTNKTAISDRVANFIS